MAPLSFLNYDTTYSFKKNNERTHSFAHTYCFADVFKRIDFNCNDHMHYTVWINTNKEYVCKKNKSNYCFLTKHELYNHIKLIKKLFDFKFSIEEQNDSFIVHIDLKGQPKIAHKYLLTWIRYVYEFPMNVMLQDVNRLRKEESCFRFTSKANLFLLLSYFDWKEYRYIHCVPTGKQGVFKSNKQLKESISDVSRLNSIYSSKAYKFDFPNWKNYNYVDKEEIDNTYKERLPFYLNFYNKVIK